LFRFDVRFGGECVSIVLPLRTTEGAEATSKSANVGRVDVDIMIEESPAAEACFFDQMSQVTKFR